jgi:glycosyltransferase involved in cell wall biosynthesis
MRSPELKTVLILTEYFAPAYKAGGIVRCLENLVVNLNSRFTFFILTSNNNLSKDELLEGVHYDIWMPFTAESKVFYASPKMQKFKTIKQAIQSIRPDIIYINGVYSPLFTLMPLWFVKNSKQKPIVVLAPHGMLHKGALSIKPLKKKIYLGLFKLIGFSKNIKWHATNEQEKDDIFRMFGKKAKVTIADVVPDIKPVPFQPIDKTNEILRLVTVSLVASNKGHLRVVRALKELQEEIQAEYHIFGPIKDALFWQTCLQEIETMKSSVKVFYHGFLNPVDLQTSLQQCHVFILHSEFENFCQAIYEALTAGRPVITSDQTPWNELQGAKAGWNVKLNDFTCLKDTIKEAYLMKQAEYDEFCKGAREKAKRFIAEVNLEKQYDLLFNTASI